MAGKDWRKVEGATVTDEMWLVGKYLFAKRTTMGKATFSRSASLLVPAQSRNNSFTVV